MYLRVQVINVTMFFALCELFSVLLHLLGIIENSSENNCCASTKAPGKTSHTNTNSKDSKSKTPSKEDLYAEIRKKTKMYSDESSEKPIRFNRVISTIIDDNEELEPIVLCQEPNIISAKTEIENEAKTIGDVSVYVCLECKEANQETVPLANCDEFEDGVSELDDDYAESDELIPSLSAFKIVDDESPKKTTTHQERPGEKVENRMSIILQNLQHEAESLIRLQE